MKWIRKYSFKNDFIRGTLIKNGLLPITNHYYEPFYNPTEIKNIDEKRVLPGINYNTEYQLSFIKNFNYASELKLFPQISSIDTEYYYENDNFSYGDSEVLYSIIRYLKPRKIIEIGSGFSTLMAINAIKKNKEEDHLFNCRHICIEPYEMTWLNKIDVELIRNKAEEIDPSVFKELEENDILFIDSTHVIKPQGDVLFEYLQLIPSLNKGVFVHIHDIFTPKDYPIEWLQREMRMWNEQYLLEAFLSNNNGIRIICMLNYLKTNYFSEISEKFPMLKNKPDSNPGSFWMQRI